MKRILFFLVTILVLLWPQLDLYGQVQFWGMTSRGGTDGAGVIFKTNADGTGYSVKKNFNVLNPGAYPYFLKLTEAPDGKLYGVTTYGGSGNYGVLFEYDPATGTYTRKIDFGPSTGTYPAGGLTLAGNGKLYGVTETGGNFSEGILFEYDPSNGNFVKKFDFSYALGGYPYASLLVASNGNLYGTTLSGGDNASGVLFEYNPSTNNYVKRFDFNYLTDGFYATGDLAQGPNGSLYGMTSYGGAYSNGILYEYDISTSSFAIKHDFGIDGWFPYGCGLTLDSNGKFYGLTSLGGDNLSGILFEYDPANDNFIKKLDFDANNGPSVIGMAPGGDLTLATNGKLYGLASSGGAYGMGTLFEYDPVTGAYANKNDFRQDQGATPLGSLIQATDGKLYGMTSVGGKGNSGVLFAYDLSGSDYSKLLDFNLATEGGQPQGSLIHASNGKLYGMTPRGGMNDNGVLFEYDTGGNYSKKVDFDVTSTGANPYGDLTEASPGKLYGVTINGGANASGLLFEYDLSNGDYTKKYDFTLASGGYPYGSLTLANGKLYGLTTGGGSKGYGVLFEYDPVSGTYLDKVDLDSASTGSNPLNSLTLVNGRLYGMTSSGGTNGAGVLFVYDPANGNFTKLWDFQLAADGGNPSGNLTLALNGKLYGMTSAGGLNNAGTVFEFDPANSNFSSKVDFLTATSGAGPRGSLTLSSNGKLYGMTYSGGAYDLGVLFEFDPSNSNFTKESDLTVAGGTYPFFTKLLFVKLNQTISFNTLPAKTYGDAPFILTATASSGLPIAYTSSDSSAAGINGNVVTILRAGSVVITATQAGDSIYFPAPNVQQNLAIAKVTPVVTWTSPSDISYGAALDSVQLDAVANTPGEFTYLPPSGTLLNVGTNQVLSVNFVPSDTADYNSVTNTQVKITVNKANQNITFDSLANKTFGDVDFSISATATSNLQVSFSATSDRITVNGSNVSIIKAGRTSIEASQNGDSSYYAAPVVDRSFCINPAKPTLIIPTNMFDPTLTSSADVGNQWYLNGTAIPGATGNNFYATVSGTYKVQVTVDDCVSAFSDDYPIVITGDLSTAPGPVQAYPNPTENYLEIIGLKDDVQDTQLFDMIGHVSSLKLERNEEVYGADIQQLPQGLYLLRVQTSTSVYQIKFVKK